MAGGEATPIGAVAIEMIWLAQSYVELAPGGNAKLAFHITNRGRVRSIPDIHVEGELAEWCKLDRGDPSAQLFDGESIAGTVVVEVPRTAAARRHELRLVARSGESQQRLEATVVVGESLVEPPKAPVVSFSAPWVELQSLRSSDLTLRIENIEEAAVEYSVELDGVGMEGRLAPRAALGPKAHIVQALSLPLAEDVASGTHMLTATVSRIDAPEVRASAKCTITSRSDPKRGHEPPPVRPPDVTVQPNPLRLSPGQSEVQVTVGVKNVSQLYETYIVSAIGPPDWCRIDNPEVALTPGEGRTVILTVTPFATRRHGAGDHHAIRVSVAPINAPLAAQIRVVNVQIPQRVDFQLDAGPFALAGRKERVKLRLGNNGSTPIDVKLSPQFFGPACEVRLPQTVRLEVAQTVMLVCTVGAQQNGLLGRPKEYAFQIAASTQGVEPAVQKTSQQVRFRHEPFMTHRFAGLTVLAGLLIAGIATLVQIGPSHAFSSVSESIECRAEDREADPNGPGNRIKPHCIPDEAS
jgi:hypothetical protein